MHFISIKKTWNGHFECSIRLYKGFGEIRIWDLGGLGTIFIVNSKKRVTRKLRRITLLHFGLVTFNFHFPKFPQSIIFMFFGASGSDQDSQKPFFLTLATPNYSRNKPESLNKKYDCWKAQNLGHRQFRKCWGRRVPTNP